MTVAIEMPQMGESVVEGTVERWLVAEGDHVEKDQTVCEITTDKVDAEIPAPAAGRVARILVQEGETVDVGTELAMLEPGEDAARASAPAPAPASVREPSAEAASPSESTVSQARATPLARRLAQEQGVDLGEVPASRDRVTRADLARYQERASEAPAVSRERAAGSEGVAAPPGSAAEFLARLKVPVYTPREGDQIQPFSAVRRRIAEHMVVSKIVSPHVGTLAEVDLHEVERFRARAKDAFRSEHGFGLSYLPFIVQATVRALREFPALHSSVVGDKIVRRRGIHVGVAVETERGLLVPVLRDTDRLSLAGIALAIQDLARRAREREITVDELQGGTFTVTNPGREGNLFGFAVINQPQVGILRTGEVRKRPVVLEADGEDTIAIRPMMYLALSYDHRIIDGVTGNGFLYRVARNLEAGDFEL
ncbi:MAG: dihydrolipoamide acetyltransferase family protein [Myxococcota bacterium]